MAELKNYNQALYAKMTDAQGRYRRWLLAQPPEQILDHAYEYAMREDILCCLVDEPLGAEQARALLRSPDPLADVYRDFSKKDSAYMGELIASLESCADAMLRKAPQREGR